MTAVRTGPIRHARYPSRDDRRTVTEPLACVSDVRVDGDQNHLGRDGDTTTGGVARVRHRADARAADGLQAAPIVTFLLVSTTAVFTIHDGIYLTVGAVVFGWLGIKMVLAALPARTFRRDSTRRARVGVVITMFNEAPASVLRCLESIAAQTHQPHKVVLVDDCSTDRDAYNAAAVFASAAPFPMELITHQANLGKRAGLRSGFEALPDVDIFFCIDSDTEITTDSIRKGARAFADKRVVAATGAVLARNPEANALTLIEAGRYASAFFGERRALSRAGSVLCVSGAVAFWRAPETRAVLDEFTSQTVLGQPTSVGDDRHLTNLMLPLGMVVFVPKAVAYTDVPERLSHYVRQQARWGRSFWLESMWLLLRLNVFTWYWWLSLGDLLIGAIVASNYVWAIIDVSLTGSLDVLPYLSLSFGWAYARNAYVFGAGMPWRLSCKVYAASGLNTALSLVVITPLRIWSLLTMHWTGWGTRQSVERIDTTTPQAVAGAS